MEAHRTPETSTTNPRVDASGPRVRVAQTDGTARLILRGELDLEDADDLNRAVTHVVGTEAHTIDVEMGRLDFIGTDCMGVLARLDWGGEGQGEARPAPAPQPTRGARSSADRSRPVVRPESRQLGGRRGVDGCGASPPSTRRSTS